MNMEAEEITDQDQDEALDRDGSVPRFWTAEHLRLRLVAAFEISFIVPPDRLGPKAYGNGWPVYSVFAEDKDKNNHINREGEPEIVRRIGPPANTSSFRRRATPQEISEMERMMEAVRDYGGFSQNTEVLIRWAEARARGWIMDEVAKSLGMPRRSFFRLRNSVSASMALWMNRCATDTF
jgi:hypothetical protein